jgi:subtilisin family serine protease
MKKGFAGLCLALWISLGAADSSFAAQNDARYIVRFKSETVKKQHADKEEYINYLQQNLKRNMVGLNKLVKSPAKADVTPLWIANAFAIDASEAEIARIRKMPSVEEVIPVEYRIYVDKDIARTPVENNPAVIQWSVQKVRAPEVWQNHRIDGAGVVVGVLDTGIDGKHPAFAGKILAYKDFTADATVEPTDKQGHGTHVAGSIAGSDGVGVAPGARLIVGRVFDNNGGTTSDALLAGMQWMLDPDGNPATNDVPRLINNTWGSNDSTNKTFWVAVENWVNAGILPVLPPAIMECGR